MHTETRKAGGLYKRKALMRESTTCWTVLLVSVKFYNSGTPAKKCVVSALFRWKAGSEAHNEVWMALLTCASQRQNRHTESAPFFSFSCPIYELIISQSHSWIAKPWAVPRFA